MPNSMQGIDWDDPAINSNGGSWHRQFNVLAIIGICLISFDISKLLNSGGWYIADDSFITLRYAWNWANSFGPVWNPGTTSVDGYSNFLWLCYEALNGFGISFDLMDNAHSYFSG